MNDDAQLIAAALGGQSSAYGQLVLKYQDRLYNTIARVMGSSEDAHDVVQDAFLQGYLKLDSYRRASAFFTWLCRIALNLAASRRRRARPMQSLDLARETTGAEPVDEGLGPEVPIEQRERASQLHLALAALSDEHRTILVLREMEDCDYTTIAEILDLPVGTVRSRLFRARMQLREQLKDLVLEDLT